MFGFQLSQQRVQRLEFTAVVLDQPRVGEQGGHRRRYGMQQAEFLLEILLQQHLPPPVHVLFPGGRMRYVNSWQWCCYCGNAEHVPAQGESALMERRKETQKFPSLESILKPSTTKELNSNHASIATQSENCNYLEKVSESWTTRSSTE